MKVPGPVHLKVAPEVVELAVRVVLVVVQFSTLEPVTVSDAGAVRVCTTLVVAVAVHPLVGLVAVAV